MMEVLKGALFASVELELLMLVPTDSDNVSRLAERDGVGEEAIRARYKKAIRRLKRHLKKGEFEIYKEMMRNS